MKSVGKIASEIWTIFFLDFEQFLDIWPLPVTLTLGHWHLGHYSQVSNCRTCTQIFFSKFASLYGLNMGCMAIPFWAICPACMAKLTPVWQMMSICFISVNYESKKINYQVDVMVSNLNKTITTQESFPLPPLHSCAFKYHYIYSILK